MKSSLLAVTLCCITTLQAATPTPDNEALVREDKANARLKAAGTAAGLNFVWRGITAVPEVYKNNTDNMVIGSFSVSPDLLKAAKAVSVTILIGVGSHVTYKLGCQALPHYLKDFQKVPQVKDALQNEHKALTMLKIGSSVAGAGAGMCMAFMGTSVWLPISCKRIIDGDVAAGLEGFASSMMCIGLGSYTFYKLMHEALPDYLNRLRSKDQEREL